MATNGDQKANSFNFTNLREASEYKLKISPEKTEELKKKPVAELVEELQIQQIEIQIQNEELKKNQMLLEKSRDKFIELYDFAPVGYFVFNHLSVIEEVNLTGSSFLGIERNKLINKSFRQFVYPDNHEIWDRHIHNVLKHDEKQTCDLLLISNNGHSIYVRLESIQLQSDNEKNKIRTAMSDITERKRDETNLRENEEKLKNLLWDMQVGVLLQGPKSEIILSNTKALDLLGLTEDQLLGKTSFDPDWNVIHEDGSPFPGPTHPVPQSIATRHSVQNVVMGVYRPSKKDRVWLLVDAVPQLNDDGTVRQVVCTFIDITERKQAEENLRKSRKEFEGYFEMGSIGMCVTSLEKGWIEVNDRLCQMFGYSKDELSRLSWSELTHSEDLDSDVELFNQILNGKRDNYQIDKRFIRKDGTILYTTLCVTCERNSDGSVNHFLASLLDITERKKIEETQLFLLQSGHQHIGKDFFQSLAQYLSEILEMEYVCIDRLLGDGLNAKTLAIYYDGKFDDNIEYALKDTPCGDVVGKTICSFPRDVRNLFQRDQALQDLKAESYVGTTLWSNDGKPIGLIAVIGRKPLEDLHLEESILKLVSIRAAGELERTQVEYMLRETERKQSALIANIADVIAIIDQEGINRYKSPNIEKWFGWKPEDVVGVSTWDNVHPDDLSRIQEFFASLLSNPNTNDKSECRYKCKDGSYKWIEFTAANLMNDPIINGVLLNYHDITERKDTDKSLKESETKFRALFEKGPIGVAYHRMIYDDVGRAIDYYFIDANESYQRLTGVDPRGKTVTQAFPGIEKDPFDWIGTFGKVAKTGETIHFEQYLQSNDRWYNCVSYQYKPDHFVAAFLEITERKRAEVALNKSEERLRLSLKATNQGLYDLNVQTGETIVNDEYALMLGYDPKTFIETNSFWIERLHPDDSEITSKAYSDYIDGRTQEYKVEFRQKTKENKWKWILSLGKIVEYDSVGKPLRMLGTHTDITERKMFEENLKESHRKLEETLTKLKETQKQVLLQEKLRSLGQMTSGICHDINNSLSPIMGFADMLCRDEEVMKKHERKLVNIIKSTKNIASTIGRLKEFYKVKLEDEVLSEKDINKIINSTIELTSHKWKNIAESTGSVITIKREFQKDLPLTKVDESELIEALTNITLNACDAMIDGGTLSFKTYQKEANIVIEVQDTGLGMDEETLQRCLDPFYSTKGDQGTGLGLSMVFGVMDRHKGEIKIESEKNKGTTVKLILPVDKSIIENDKIDEIVKDLKPLKILSVEDDKTISEMLKLMLETKGNKVESALNGKVGLELYKQALEKREPFDLVITDLGMAEMDGNSLSKAIKEITPNVPVILLTGWGTLIDKNDYKTVDCLLKKPIMMEDLFKGIAGLFEEK